MSRITTFFAALYALYSLPLIPAWTFVWRNASGNATVEENTGAQPCKAIDHAKGNYFEYNPDDSLVRIYAYESPNCTDDPDWKAEGYLARVSTSPIRGFAVIDLSGASTSTNGVTEPFPGTDWFKSSPNSPIITAMGTRLVAEACGKYKKGPGPQWSEVDRESYQCWQEKLGYSGADADGWPGKTSWDQLKVPLTGKTGTTITTDTPSGTSTNAGTPASTSASVTDVPSRPPLGGGEIAGIVVGVVVGLGLIGAIVYLARRIGWRSAPTFGEGEPESAPVDASIAGGPKKSSTEESPMEPDAIPAEKYIAELPVDTATAELSDSRRLVELADGRT